MNGIAFRARGKCPIPTFSVADDRFHGATTETRTADGSHLSSAKKQLDNLQTDLEKVKVELLDSTFCQWAF